MRRTRWAVFTSMNPREPVWRTLYDRLPAEVPVPERAGRPERDESLPGMAEPRVAPGDVRTDAR